jgi:hyaluronate lyase
MDRVVHRAGDWSAGLSLYSARIAPYESINGENRRGWHTSSGHLALFNGDRRQFVDGFWPTVNAYRLPGTTVVAGAEPKGERSKARFVGGVVGPDGISGMSVLDLNVVPEGDPSARKAWVFLENEIVCLGSAIRSNTGEVETIVENRKLGSNAQASFVTEPATPMLTVQNAPGTPVVLKNISYAHLEEGGGLPGIGYVFPKPVDLSAIRESRTDTWKSINVTSLLSIDEKPITNEFLTLWLNHGFSPKDASYEYILLPRATEKETAAYAAAPSVQILSNTPDLQAVSSRGGKFLAIAFWDPKGGTLVAGQQTVKLDGPGLVIIDEGPNGIRVAIADPSQLGASPLTLQIGRRFSRIEQADPSIEKGATDGALRFDPSGLRGRTASAVLR